MHHIVGITTVIIIIFFSHIANATCQQPAGSAGTMRYNEDATVLQWCDGVQWIGLPTPKAPETYQSVIAAGASHSCAIDGMGQAWCWGEGSAGQLGNGEGTDSPTPVMVAGDHHFKSISATGNATCALDTDGAAWCWGEGTSGQLGYGSTASMGTPVVVAGGHQFVSISVGHDHSCAIDTANAGWCWGTGGAAAGSLTPVQIDHGTDLIALEAGDDITCSIGGERHVRCSTHAGPLTMDNYASGYFFTALAVGTDTKRTEMICGTGSPFLICWRRTGAMWSLNGLGAGTVVQGLDVGGAHQCLILPDGQVQCRGNNESGQLGDGTTNATTSLVKIIGAEPMMSIATGDAHSCGKGITGSIWCWGDNSAGQLGDGTTTGSSEPIKVQENAFKSCQSPSGTAGDLIYNSDQSVLQWCNGTTWVGLPKPTGSGSGEGECSDPSGTTGAVLFNDTHKVFQWCDGSQWIAFPKPLEPCVLDGTVVPHGTSSTFYSSEQAPHCDGIAQLRNCSKGLLDGDPSYVHANCTVEPGPADCPQVGDLCSDGSYYAGRTPDGWTNMFVSANETSKRWGLSGYQEGMHPNPTLNGNRPNWSGRANTRYLAAYDGTDAALYCDHLNAHGHTDWYLPAVNEMSLLWSGSSPIAGLNPSSLYWTSTGGNSTYAMASGFSSGATMTAKTSTNSVRCVRTDAPALPAPTCDDYFAPPGTVCEGGSQYAGQYLSGRYFIASSAPNKRWGPSGSTGVTSPSDGKGNTATLAGLGSTYDAAYYCDTLDADGHDDWFLPATNEWQILCLSRNKLGGFSGYHWTSTEASSSSAQIIYQFTNCSSLSYTKTVSSVKTLCVRRD